MSEWFYRQFIHTHISNRPSNKPGVGVIISSIFLITIGIFLLNNILKSHNNDITHQELGGLNEKNFSPSVLYWQEQIETWANIWSLDPYLVATVIQIESCGNPQALSPVGAHGLFQVMPYHFNVNENMLDPETNANRGLNYLSQSFITAKGDIELTLAGYNGGHAQITRPPNLWPDETRRYTYWGSGIYYDAISGNGQGETLQTWLASGGWQLCQLAESILGLK